MAPRPFQGRPQSCEKVLATLEILALLLRYVALLRGPERLLKPAEALCEAGSSLLRSLEALWTRRKAGEAAATVQIPSRATERPQSCSRWLNALLGTPTNGALSV